MGVNDGFRHRPDVDRQVRTIAQDLTPLSDARLRFLAVVRTVRAVVYALLLVAGVVAAVRLQATAMPELLSLTLATGALVLLAVTVGGLVRVRLEQRGRARVAALLAEEGRA